ncbi:DNA-binding transcriptional regulator, FrmR family [Cryobacterium flavum]|uniref:DNA-binding transcriptional regulator, FrmR family n=2 Tax=Cryobacterium flavum TaxID=1424659 RepID=A0A5E9FUW7_9MICO|nr:DNA-binding transcriptional regulator, FrmR family [Cryobacterium flavum]
MVLDKTSLASAYEQEHTLMGITESATHASDDLRKTLNRLKRAQGQLGAVITAVESGADCRAVVTQLAAVSSAIDRAGFTIISSAMKECLIDNGADGETKQLSVNELEKLFLSLA